MKKHPFTYATFAAFYIVLIVSFINSMALLGIPEKTPLIPITMLSLLVLSVAIMGFLFFYEPFYLYFDNHKQEAVRFLIRTIGFFACFVVFFLTALIYTSLL